MRMNCWSMRTHTLTTTITGIHTIFRGTGASHMYMRIDTSRWFTRIIIFPMCTTGIRTSRSGLRRVHQGLGKLDALISRRDYRFVMLS